MKRQFAGFLVSLLCVATLAGCNNEMIDTPEELAKNEFLVNWIKTFGLIDANQDWNMARRVTADINVESFGADKTVYVYNADPADGGALMGVFSTSRSQNLDVDKNATRLFARAYDAELEHYSQYTFDIAGDRVQVSGAQSRAEVLSRADDGNSLGSPYQWILACEDLGATDDTDFNDIVIGLSYIAGDNAKLKVTPLAAGGIYETKVKFKDTELFEIHQALGSEACITGNYKMKNTRSWDGAGNTMELTVGDDFTVTDGMGGFTFEVARPGSGSDTSTETVNITLNAPVAGEAPQVICVPGNWEWPKERTSITAAYPNFEYWSRDHTLTDWNNAKVSGTYMQRITDNVLPGAGSFIDDQTITINGVNRTYDVYIPDGIKTNAPVVFSLHGANNHKEDQMPFRKEMAEEVKCIVVYPQGLNQYFPAVGGSVPGWDASGDTTADLDFFKAIIEKLSTDYKIDLTRVYCCGFSNGGMMTYNMATMASDIFAAFASVSGIPMNEAHHRPSTIRPVPFLHIHGRNDNFVKYSCLAQIRDDMVAANGCNPVPQVTELAGMYTKSVYEAQSGGFPYITYEVNGLGHWYAHGNLYNNNTGKVIWDFFKDYTLLSACDATLRWRLNIDTDGFNPEEHHWDVINDLYFTYGGRPNNGSDNNVYPSIQLAPGNYYMEFNTIGNSSNRIKVALETLSGTKLFSKSAQVGSRIVVPFTVTGAGIQQLRIRILKTAATDKFTMMEIHTDNTGRGATGSMYDEDFSAPTATGQDIELAQTQFVEGSGFYAIAPEGNNPTIYKATRDRQFAFKTTGENGRNDGIDVTGCDYVCIEFAEPVNFGWYVNVTGGMSFIPVPAGTTKFRYYIPAGTTKLNEISLLTFIDLASSTTIWENTAGLTLQNGWYEYLRYNAAEATTGFAAGDKVKFYIAETPAEGGWPQALLSGPGWDPYANAGTRGNETVEIPIGLDVMDNIRAKGLCIRGESTLFSKIEHIRGATTSGVTYTETNNGNITYHVVAKVKRVYKHKRY